MDLPNAVYAFRWFVRDTFRQASDSRLSWLMLGCSGVFVALCLSVGVNGEVPLQKEGVPVDFLPSGDPLAETVRVSSSGVAVVGGQLTVFFGFIRVPLGRDAAEAVHFLELLLAGLAADTFGVLLALVWTSGFFSSFLDPNSASVLLAKPIPRWLVLLGKYVGVLAFVSAHILLFVFGTWSALGIKTGQWRFDYLLCIPIFVFHFAVFFAVSCLLAIRTRSTVVCAIGSLSFWLLCWGVNYTRHAMTTTSEGGTGPQVVRTLAETGYWVLPKPSDLSMVLFDSLNAGRSFHRPEVFHSLDKLSVFQPSLSLATSFLFAFVTLAACSYLFASQDY